MWSWVLAVLACGSTEPEPADEASEAPAVGEPTTDATVAAAGEPGPADAPPDADGERAGEGLGKVRLEGTVSMEGFSGGVIQLDAVSMTGGQPKVVAVERYPRIGPFRMDVRGGHDSVLLVAYHDLAGDGPSADDPRFEYEGNPIDLTVGETVSDISFALVEPVDPTLSALAPDDQKTEELPGEGGDGPPEGAEPQPIDAPGGPDAPEADADPTGNAAPSEAAQAEGSDEAG